MYCLALLLMNKGTVRETKGVHLRMQCISAAEKRSISGQTDHALEG